MQHMPSLFIFIWNIVETLDRTEQWEAGETPETYPSSV